MRIFNEKGEVLELPENVIIPIELSNPFLQDYGSRSLQVDLPNTASNRKTLGFPSNINRRYMLPENIRMYIEHGVIQKPAKMSIESADDRTISVSFLFNESEIYAQMQDLDLSTIVNRKRSAENPNDFVVPGDETQPDVMAKLIRYLELVMVNHIEDDFLLFPVGYNTYTYTYTSKTTSYNYDIIQSLNDFYWGDVDNELKGFTTDIIPGTSERYRILEGRYAREVWHKDDKVDVPRGYGISPFLKLNYVLKVVFEYFGYEIDPQSLFFTHDLMKRTVLVNNTADSIVNAKLDYAQLVPDISVGEFLKFLRNDYGCEFFLNESTKTVDFRFWKDVLQLDTERVDISKYVAGKHRTEFMEAEQVKLTNKRSVNHAKQDYETLERFTAHYGDIPSVKMMDDLTDNDKYKNGIYYIESQGTYIEKTGDLYGETGTSSGVNWKYISSNLYDYYLESEKEADRDSENYREIESEREYLPHYSGYKRTYKGQVGASYPELVKIVGFYIDDIRHLNTKLKRLPVEGEDSEKDVYIEEENSKLPLITAFHRVDEVRYQDRLRHIEPKGCLVNRDWKGNRLSADGWDLVAGGKEGMFEYFWKDFDAVLRHSFHKLDLTLHFSSSDVLKWDMGKIVYYKGQPLLPEVFQMNVGNRGIGMIRAEFRMLRLYEDVEETE